MYIPSPKLINVIRNLYHLMIIIHSSHPHSCLGNYQFTLCFYEFSFFQIPHINEIKECFPLFYLFHLASCPPTLVICCFRLLQNLAAESRKHLASTILREYRFCADTMFPSSGHGLARLLTVIYFLVSVALSLPSDQLVE